MIELSGKQDQPGQHELTAPKIFKYSWLDTSIQASLVAEIIVKTQEALHGTVGSKGLYVVFSRRYYEEAVNLPFTITRKQPVRFSAQVFTGGPFEPRFACAYAFLEQEGTILIGSRRLNVELRDTFKAWGITSVKALGQGIDRLSGQLNAQRQSEPSLSIEQLVKEVKRGNRPQLVKEIEQYQERYKSAHEHFGYGEDSTSFSEWKRAEDRLRGFDQGALLLDELLTHPWKL